MTTDEHIFFHEHTELFVELFGNVAITRGLFFLFERQWFEYKRIRNHLYNEVYEALKKCVGLRPLEKLLPALKSFCEQNPEGSLRTLLTACTRWNNCLFKWAHFTTHHPDYEDILKTEKVAKELHTILSALVMKMLNQTHQ